MKYFVILASIFYLAINSYFNLDPNSLNSSSSVFQNINFENLYQTWYTKQILINGMEDPENFPVNNDELALNRDMTCVSVDKTYDLVEKGTWEIIKPDKFSINGEDDTFIFKIIKLTETELETKMVTDEINMIIKYKNIK